MIVASFRDRNADFRRDMMGQTVLAIVETVEDLEWPRSVEWGWLCYQAAIVAADEDSNDVTYHDRAGRSVRLRFLSDDPMDAAREDSGAREGGRPGRSAPPSPADFDTNATDLLWWQEGI